MHIRKGGSWEEGKRKEEKKGETRKDREEKRKETRKKVWSEGDITAQRR